MRSKKELSEMDRKHVLHPTSQLKEIQDNGPRIIVEGNGTRIKDIDGKEYIDAFSTLWNVVIGHGRKAVVDAIVEQMDKLEYFSSFFGFSNPPAIKLAAKVAAAFGIKVYTVGVGTIIALAHIDDDGVWRHAEFNGSPRFVLEGQVEVV